MHILDEEVRDARAVGDEVAGNAFAADDVFAIWADGGAIACDYWERGVIGECYALAED